MRAPLRSISALVASVVPCTTAWTASWATPASPSNAWTACSTPWAGSFEVVRTLPTRTAPVVSSTTTRSVNVPPMSTPRRASMRAVYNTHMKKIVSLTLVAVLATSLLVEPALAQQRRLITIAAFKGKPVKNMGGVFTIYPELVHIVATQASGVRSVRDLKGKRVVLGPQGSGTEQNALQTLGVYGIKGSDLGKAEHLDAGAASRQLKNGGVD